MIDGNGYLVFRVKPAVRNDHPLPFHLFISVGNIINFSH